MKVWKYNGWLFKVVKLSTIVYSHRHSPIYFIRTPLLLRKMGQFCYLNVLKCIADDFLHSKITFFNFIDWNFDPTLYSLIYVFIYLTTLCIYLFIYVFIYFTVLSSPACWLTPIISWEVSPSWSWQFNTRGIWLSPEFFNLAFQF